MMKLELVSGSMFLQLILFFLTSVAIADTKLPSTTPDLFGFLEDSCDGDLATAARKQRAQSIEKMDVMQAYVGFRMGNLPAFHGYLVETKKPDKFSEVKELNLPALIKKTKDGSYVLKRPFWKTQILRAGTERVRMVDVGYQNLVDESERINRRIADHIVTDPHNSLRINFDETRSAAMRALVNIRSWVHDAVIDEYKELLKYLTTEEIQQLVIYNHQSNHNDVFALLSPDAKPIEQMSYEDLKEHILMALQISYFGTRNYLAPSLKGIVEAAGFEMDETSDPLPWEYLVPKKYLPAFRARIYAMFDAKKACEFNRYLRFDSFEDSFQDYFLLNALARAHRRGVVTILANTTNDLVTRKFVGYGFKKIAEIPTDENPDGLLLDDEFKAKKIKRENVKYLLRLVIGSDKFNGWFDKLAIKSSNVTVEKE
jgi:hypothetical protein